MKIPEHKKHSEKNFSYNNGIRRMVRHQKVLGMYKKTFAQENKWNIFMKRFFFYFHNLNSMKKSLLASTLTGGLLVIGIYMFSFQNTPLNPSGLTFETLIAKAQTIEAKKATTGRYYHEKLKSADYAKGNTELTPSFQETWKDTESKDLLSVSRDINTNKIVWANLIKDGKNYIYSGDGILTSTSALSAEDQILPDASKIGKTLQDFMQTRNDSALKNLFPANWKFESIRYEGQTTRNNKQVETLVLKSVDEGLEMRFYFDAQTFEFVSLQTENKQMNQIINQLEVISSDYSNQIPSVQVGLSFLSLAQRPTSQGTTKTYEDTTMKFLYPSLYTLKDLGTKNLINDNSNKHLQLSRENGEGTINITVSKGVANPKSYMDRDFNGKTFEVFDMDKADHSYHYEIYHNGKNYTFSTSPFTAPIQFPPYNQSLEFLMNSVELK